MQIRECELEHFDRYRFQFGSLEDVEHYWSELQNVCTGTRLNRRRFDESGNEVIVEVENKASSWIPSILNAFVRHSLKTFLSYFLIHRDIFNNYPCCI